jgi:hypothetical protein
MKHASTDRITEGMNTMTDAINSEAQAMMAAADRALAYGVNETNNIAFSEVSHKDIDHSVTLQLGDPNLARIVRLRLLSDPGFPFWDISYCYGQTKAGALVRVNLGTSQLTKRNMKGDLINLAKAAGVYAKGLNLLNDDIISKLN